MVVFTSIFGPTPRFRRGPSAQCGDRRLEPLVGAFAVYVQLHGCILEPQVLETPDRVNAAMTSGSKFSIGVSPSWKWKPQYLPSCTMSHRAS